MTVQHNQATAGADWATEQKIANDLYSNFLVEASAGTGKTYSLVTRVVSLIKAGPANGGATMDRLVAITFTEAAAAELSDRIRSRMEQLLADHHPDDARDARVLGPLSADERARIETAIRDIDQATIQTIHGFAGQLLRERPTDVGLPSRLAAVGRSGRDPALQRILGALAGTIPRVEYRRFPRPAQRPPRPDRSQGRRATVAGSRPHFQRPLPSPPQRQQHRKHRPAGAGGERRGATAGIGCRMQRPNRSAPDTNKRRNRHPRCGSRRRQRPQCRGAGAGRRCANCSQRQSRGKEKLAGVPHGRPG